MTDVSAVTARIEQESAFLRDVVTEVERVIVGQRELIDGLLIALLCGGHALVEGVPGLAKTTAIRTLAKVLGR